MDGVAGFTVHHTMDCNIGFWMRGRRVFSRRSLWWSEWLWTIIENESLGRYLISNDSMSSIRGMESGKISLHTLPFVYECKQKCWQLARSGLEVSFIWVPAHVRIAENKRAGFEARQATLGNMVYNAQPVVRNLLPVAKQTMLEELAEELGGRWTSKVFALYFSQGLS
jgi:hypothetical protein